MEARSASARIVLAFVLAAPVTMTLACSDSTGGGASAAGASASSGCEAEPPAERAPDVEATPIAPEASAPTADAAVGETAGAGAGCDDCGDGAEAGDAEGIALVRRVVEDPSALVSAIDPERGLVVARYEEATPGARGVRSNHRICGAPTRARGDEVRTILRDAIARTTPEEEWDCDAERCSIAPMEYVPAVRIHFAHDTQGRLVLAAITSTSEALLPEDEITAANDYVRAAIDRARTTPCRPSAR